MSPELSASNEQRAAGTKAVAFSTHPSRLILLLLFLNLIAASRLRRPGPRTLNLRRRTLDSEPRP